MAWVQRRTDGAVHARHAPSGAAAVMPRLWRLCGRLEAAATWEQAFDEMVEANETERKHVLQCLTGQYEGRCSDWEALAERLTQGISHSTVVVLKKHAFLGRWRSRLTSGTFHHWAKLGVPAAPGGEAAGVLVSEEEAETQEEKEEAVHLFDLMVWLENSLGLLLGAAKGPRRSIIKQAFLHARCAANAFECLERFGSSGDVARAVQGLAGVWELQLRVNDAAGHEPQDWDGLAAALLEVARVAASRDDYRFMMCTFFSELLAAGGPAAAAAVRECVRLEHALPGEVRAVVAAAVAAPGGVAVQAAERHR